MKHESIYKKLKKAGANIEQKDNWFYARKGKNTVIWIKQYDSAICIHTPSPYTDIMTDCYCDRYHHTIKQALNELNG